MKKITSFCLSILLLVSCLFGTNLMSVYAADSFDVNINVKYCQSEARKVFPMINSFRTGNEAWYWNSSNSQKVYANDLSTLTYDYDLEKIAMQRAAEIAISFAHTRPNGERCFTAYPNGYWSMGENIAAGYRTAEAVHIGLREDDDDYSGQGHRRNMLGSNFTAVGIGCVYYKGCYYWAEEFASPTKQINSVDADDSYKDVTINVSGNQIKSMTLSADKSQISLIVDEQAELPNVTAEFILNGSWPGFKCSGSVTPKWTVSNASVAKIQNNKVVGISAGSTQLTASVAGEQISLPIEVKNELSGEMSITLEKEKFQYTGSSIQPVIKSVTIGDRTLNSSDFTVSYTNNTEIGTATVTVTGKGKYSGYTCSKNFEIYCEHRITKKNGVAPTCTETGLSEGSYCSICGEVFAEQQVLPATDHSTSAVEIKAATCEEAGEIGYFCDICNSLVSTEIIPATGHQYEEYYTARWPSCDSTGLRYYMCQKCGDLIEEVLPANGHIPGEPKVIVVEPTCTSDGSRFEEVYCSYCGELLSSEFTVVPKLSHQYVARTIVPTCTSKGYTLHTCQLCGDSYTDNYVNAKGHVAGEPVEENYVAPTYNREGSYDEVTYCRVCNTELSRNTVVLPIVACAHKNIVKNETVVKKATCTENGEKVITEICNDCGVMISRTNEIIPKIAHRPSQSVKENMISATCTKAGSYDEVVYCSVCKNEISRVTKTVAKLAHTATPAVKENILDATCTKAGSYDEVVYCSVCKTELSRKHKSIAILAHQWDNGVITKQATGTSTGLKIYTCRSCGEKKSEVIPKKAINSKNGWFREGKNLFYFINGTKAKGWQKINNNWYLLANNDGRMLKGWQKSGGKWYYFNNSGIMQKGWQKVSGKWYYFNSSGAMVTGWQKISNKWYYFNSSGAMQTGWLKSGGKWYYFNTDGAMVTGTRKIGSKTYRFNSSGACLNP